MLRPIYGVQAPLAPTILQSTTQLFSAHKHSSCLNVVCGSLAARFPPFWQSWLLLRVDVHGALSSRLTTHNAFLPPFSAFPPPRDFVLI